MAAGAFTYYVLCRGFEDVNELDLAVKSTSQEEKEKSVMQIMADGGQEGVKIVFNMIPMLILAIFLVNVLKATGAIELISLGSCAFTKLY